MFWSYAFWWRGVQPWESGEVAWASLQFSLAMMAIFSAHEAGHYIVGRLHGIDQSLPHFIPFPLAFGTLGAVIRLRSMPPSRTALLEMGAAGPLAGFALSCIVFALGLGDTVSHAVPEVVLAWPPPLPAPTEPGWLDAALGTPPLSWVFPATSSAELPLLVMANPLLMDGIGMLVIGEVPGRYDELSPIAFAGWAGCFLTAMNLLPIGQLDGGHVLNAMFPGAAAPVARAGLWLLAAGGLLWGGWLFWALVIWRMGVHRSLPMSSLRPPSNRARMVSGLVVLAMLLCFMPTPLEMEQWKLEDLVIHTPDGREVSATEKAEFLRKVAAQRGEATDGRLGQP
jgi:membrane-associated protease RseP (regulator of RpoE activity)